MKQIIGIILCGVMLAGWFCVCPALPQGLVAYWPFDGNAQDQSGNGINGTLIGNVQFTNGVIDSALELDTGNGQYMSIGHPDLAPPWSVSLWARKAAATRSAAMLNSEDYSLRLAQWSNTQKVGVTVYGVQDYTFDFTSPLNEWIHLVFIGSSNSVTLWANGNLVGSISVSMPCPLATIGRDRDPLIGALDDVAVFSRQLAAEEITSIYHNGLAGISIRAMGRTAWGPDPDDGATGLAPDITLQWHGPEAGLDPTYNFYFGTDSQHWAIERTGLTENTFQPPMSYLQHYFWRVDTVVDDEVYPGQVWQFQTGGKAVNPQPADRQQAVTMPAVTLSWSGDAFATKYKVYLSDRLPLPDSPIYTGSRASFTLDDLQPQTTYFWRVDEYVDEVPTVPGDTWQFTTRKQPPQCPAGDINGDCRVGPADLVLMAGQWLSTDNGSADLVQPGIVNLDDFAVLAHNWLRKVPSRVVINEIHYNPDVKTELVEFVELYNTGPADMDLSGWYFDKGIHYTFPTGVILPAGGYLAITEDPTPALEPVTVADKYGVAAEKIFGPFGGKLGNNGDTLELCNADGKVIDRVKYKLGFPWPTVGDAVPDTDAAAGSGHSIQLTNPDFDNDLAGAWRSAYPTPGAENTSVYTGNIPPCIRQVKHQPKQPGSGEIVTITAKVTDPDGVAAVILQYQPVDPGHYIRYQYSDEQNHRLLDPEYETGWVDLAMNDAGIDGDKTAGDNIYTLQIPGQVQIHRRLVRYRIIVRDTLGNQLRVPYADDPQPNFAYFVYDGVPAWHGAVNPAGSAPANQVKTFGAPTMSSVTTYHLIAKQEDINTCQYVPIDQHTPAAQWYQWSGTLVYNGDVYDNIWYRNRGWWSTYAWGKNKWKFDFNRGHYFQARDDYGKKYREKWDKLNFSACIQQEGASHNRGEQGMYEAVTFKLFNLASVPAPHTQWVHFRVIDQAQEETSNQYEGDFWGLYLAIEQPDGRFLEEHDLPDGNYYKMFFPLSGDNGNRNNQGPTQVTDHSDVANFCRTYRNYPPEQWWHANAELGEYYSYRVVADGVHHYDLTDRWNCCYYHNPVTGRWWITPWDVDLSWDTNIYSSDDERWKQVLDYRLFPHVNSSMFRNYPDCTIEFQNRARELLDLLLNADQCGQIIDEFAGMINRTDNHLSFVDADRAMWDYNPHIKHPGRFYQNSPTGDFAGMVQRMKDFISPDGWGGKRLAFIANDPDIPNQPTVVYTGSDNYPLNDLHFVSTDFSDPQGSSTFAALQWRIAEVEPFAQSQPNDKQIVLLPEHQAWHYFKGTQEPSTPLNAWRTIEFPDDPTETDWLTGELPLGYGESFLATTLADMRYNYTTVYLRHTFEVTNPAQIASLVLAVQYDDGFNAWINGVHVAGANVVDSEIPYNGIAQGSREDSEFIPFVLNDPTSFLTAGTNVIAIQLLNVSRTGSSDCFIDVRLTATPAETGQTKPPTYTFSGKEGKYEIIPTWMSPTITDITATSLTVPADVVKSGRTYRVRCRMQDNTGRWSHWSEPVQFSVGDPIAANIRDNLRITEIMYNPAPAQDNTYDNDDFEFVELKNTGDEPLDLSGTSFTAGINFSFAAGEITRLGAGDFALVVKNRTAFLSRYGMEYADRIAGEYTGKLSNSGEQIVLSDAWNGILADFTYDDTSPWPVAADGGGHALVPLEAALRQPATGSADYPYHWRAGTFIGGSPGRDDPEPLPAPLINEIMAETSHTADGQIASNDWIELYNPTDMDIHLADWYLSDDLDALQKWQLPAAVIPAHGRITFDEIHGFHQSPETGFGLDKNGEQVVLSYIPATGPARIGDALTYTGQQSTLSLGRFPDGSRYFFLMPPTPDAPNAAPENHIIISEIMYHPTPAGEEFLELSNPTDKTVDLFNQLGPWRINRGVDFTFPAGISLAPHASVLLVGFNPFTDTVRLEKFATHYQTGTLTPGINILGGWNGNLSNREDWLTLEKPLRKTTAGTGFVWTVMDEVHYLDQAPFPDGADGTGLSLQRTTGTADKSGNDPQNWQAQTPSPLTTPW